MKLSLKHLLVTVSLLGSSPSVAYDYLATDMFGDIIASVDGGLVEFSGQFKDDNLVKFREAAEKAVEVNKGKRILLEITSIGGSIWPGYEILDVLLESGIPVDTLSSTESLSMGAYSWLIGETRYVNADSSIMFHVPHLYGHNFKVWERVSKLMDDPRSEKFISEVRKLSTKFIVSPEKVAYIAMELGYAERDWFYLNIAVEEFGRSGNNARLSIVTYAEVLKCVAEQVVNNLIIEHKEAGVYVSREEIERNLLGSYEVDLYLSGQDFIDRGLASLAPKELRETYINN